MLDVFEDRLGESEYLAGENFSIADISFGVFYGFSTMVEQLAKVDFELGRPHLTRWYETLSKRPSFS